jgi:CRP/FNR family transcriptional regulator, polysaccharide utilization system transcription regulator
MIRQNCDNCSVFHKSYFDMLSTDDLLELSNKKTCRSYKKGQTIYTSGTRPNGIYCLQKGKVMIYKTGPYGKEQIVRFVLPGDFIGMRAALGDKNYSSNAVTLEESVICFIAKQDFQMLMIKCPQITSAIIATLSKLLEESDNKVTSLAQKTVRERLAETLITLNDVFKSDSIDSESVITLPRRDLANLVGTATETVIRLLSELKTDKIISIKGRKITIQKIRELTKIANLSD